MKKDNDRMDSKAHERMESKMTERTEERKPDGRASPRVPPEVRAAHGHRVPQDVKDCYKK